RETMGYLPRCDLGVLLVEASSALGRDEIDLLRRLGDSGIDAQVVLSKADLVPAAERERVRAYFAHEIERALGRSVPVDLVSAIDAKMAKAWFGERIAPLISRAAELIAESANRKLAALQATTIGILRSLAEHAQRPAPGTSDEIDRLVLAIEGRLRTTGEHVDMLLSGLGDGADRVIRTAARKAHATGEDVHAAVIAALGEEADSVRHVLEADLTATRTGLRDLLHELSRVARIGLEPPEVRLDLVSEPVIAIPEAVSAADLSMPHWPAVERRLAARIDAALGGTIREVLTGYARELREWSERVLRDVGTQVAAYVEPCRALGHDAGSRGDNVAEDLAALEQM
ncbi:MAG TPA: hypothetical protein VLX92_15640, partial [Kofleriaceae bacterium]|nr:hypothetical protein [Kofleriaceae bacterium]